MIYMCQNNSGMKYCCCVLLLIVPDKLQNNVSKMLSSCCRNVDNKLEVVLFNEHQYVLYCRLMT